LISLRGLECLKQADFILYDGLVNPLLLRHTQAEAVRTARANTAGKRVLNQQQINERLVTEALQGKTVVRLKGGDPYIFGRGSEEASVLAEHGIEFEVVPGITAATAAAEYAGFSLTHRDHASAVCLITGHEDPDKAESALDYNLLARFPGTLVFYMGLHRLPDIAHALIAEGLSSETPAAVITKASTPFQRVVTAPLGALPQKVSEANLSPPSLIIIGHCVNMRQQIQWFESKPLFGQRIGITRPSHQAEPQIQRAIELGADPVLMPMIEIEPPDDFGPLDRSIEQITSYEWLVFTSSNGIEHDMQRLWSHGYDLRQLSDVRFACIGSSTAATLERFHLRADLVPEDYCSESLAQALIEVKPTGKILWPRANRGRDVIIKVLREAGLTIDEVVAYRHRDLDELEVSTVEAIAEGSLNWIGLSSPAIARQLARVLPEELHSNLGRSTRIAAISPITAEAAKEAGLPVEVMAEEYTWDGIFKAIEECNKN